MGITNASDQTLEIASQSTVYFPPVVASPREFCRCTRKGYPSPTALAWGSAPVWAVTSNVRFSVQGDGNDARADGKAWKTSSD